MVTGDRIDRLSARLKEANQSFVVATVVRTEDLTSAKAGAKALVDDRGRIEGWVGGGCVQPAVRKAALQAMDDGRARLIRVRPGKAVRRVSGIEEYEAHCHSGGTIDIFIEPVLPRPMLVVLGASPVGQVLARLAREVGYRVTAACTAEDAPLYESVDRLIEGFELGGTDEPGSFVVVATQGRGDIAALEAALSTGAAYVAFVASRRKATRIKQELVDSGFEASRVSAIRAPAGLDIAALTPEEVAVSILGEMTQFRRAPLPQPERIELEDEENQVLIEVVAQGSCVDPENG